MSLREKLWDYSCGNGLGLFWRMFLLRQRTKSRLGARILSFLINCSARRHGGYVGVGAQIASVPSLPHGLHGIYISRFASVGPNCRIYQNVTIGEVDGKAPKIGGGCLIGAGAWLVGDITIGENVKIGAGAVVASSIPAGSTVVAQAPRVLVKGGAHG